MRLLRLNFVLATLIAPAWVLSQTTNPTVADAPPSSQPTTGPSAERVAALIQLLGSDQWRERENAQRELVIAGAAAADALAKTAEADDVDPEVKSRAAAALSAIRSQDTDGPSLITMHMQNVPAQQVLDSVAEQAHMRFNTDIFPTMVNRTITVNADARPFWEVMEQICVQLGACPLADGTAGRDIRLQPMPQNWLTQAPHHVVGPFVVAVTEVHRARTVDLTGSRGTDQRFGIQLSVFAEPKVMVAQMSGMELTEATDDAGRSLLPAQRVPNATIGRVRAGQVIDVPLQYPENAGKTIALIRGSVKVAVGQNVQRFQVDDLLGAMKQTQTLSGRWMEVQITKSSADDYQVVVTMKRGSLPQDQWIAMINRASDIALEDAEGHRMTTNGWGGGGGGDDYKFNGHYTRNVRPAGRPMQKLGEPTRLVWDVPTKVKTISVPVEFRDLPMP